MQRTLTRAGHLRLWAQNTTDVADWVEKLANILDDGGAECSCCGSFRYRSFPQHILKQKIIGASDRLREIANTLVKRADDPEFEDHREKQEVK